MTSKIISNGILKAIATLLLFSLGLFVLFQIQLVIIYLIIAIIVTLISNPIVEFLRKKLKFSNNLAVITTILLFVVLFISIFLLFVPLIISQSKNLALLDTQTIQNNVVTITNNLTSYLNYHHIDAAKIIQESNIASKLNLNFIPTILNSVLGAVSGFGMGLLSVLFITFFILKDKVQFIASIKRMLPESHEEKILNSLSKINIVLSKYFSGLVLQLTIVFILYLIVLLIFKIENAFIIALLCAILNIVPYVGPLIGSILAAFLTMTSHIGGNFQTEVLPLTVKVLLGFWIVQIIDNNVSQPIIFSKSLNSHPLEIFIITLMGGFLFGITGMIIAVPTYTMLKVIAKEFFPENRVVKTIIRNGI